MCKVGKNSFLLHLQTYVMELAGITNYRLISWSWSKNPRFFHEWIKYKDRKGWKEKVYHALQDSRLE